MPIGTPVHERTFALCESLNYREWSGYYTVSAYESHHEHDADDEQRPRLHLQSGVVGRPTREGIIDTILK